MIGFVDAVKMGFNRCFDFHTRSSRAEFWWWALFSVAANIILGLVSAGLANLLGLLLFVPYVALLVRRIHDIGHRGWWGLVVLVPGIGFIATLYFGLRAGDGRENEWGPAPVLD